MTVSPAETTQTGLVTIIIPTFNNGAFIGQTVASALAQAYAPVEVIVVDDGSTDDTAVLLAPLQAHIRYHYQPNQGVSAARNQGLALARGEYVVFLDGDDVLLPDKLSRQTAVLARHPHAGICHSGWQLIQENGTVLGSVAPWQDAARLDLAGWLLWKPVFLGAMLFRREWLLAAGGFDTSLRQAEDVDLILRLAAAGCPAVWHRETTVQYRQHGSSTMRNGRVQAESINRVLDNFYARDDLPAAIRAMADDVRFYTLMWTVWQLHTTGYDEDIPTYLTLSCRYRSLPWRQMLQLWLRQMGLWCQRDNVPLETVADFFPHFRLALQLSEADWLPVAAALHWWLRVWRHYQAEQAETAVTGLRHYQSVKPAALVRLAQQGVLFSPQPPTARPVWWLRRDGRVLGLFAPADDARLVALALTTFGQAALMKRPFSSLGALLIALWLTRRPAALSAWFQFIRAAWRYAFGAGASVTAVGGTASADR